MLLNKELVAKYKNTRKRGKLVLLSMLCFGSFNCSIVANADKENVQVVHNQQELVAALENRDINKISLENDVQMENPQTYYVPARSLLIDLNEHQLNLNQEQIQFKKSENDGVDSWNESELEKSSKVEFCNTHNQADKKDVNLSNGNSNDFHSEDKEKKTTEETSQKITNNPTNNIQSDSLNKLNSKIEDSKDNNSQKLNVSNKEWQVNKTLYSRSVTTPNNNNNVQQTKNDSNVKKESDDINGIKQSNLDLKKTIQKLNETLLKFETEFENRIKNFEQRQNELEKKKNQKLNSKNKNKLFSVNPHRVHVKRKCYIYSDATFALNKRLRLATNKELSNQKITQHGSSKAGRLRYKVKSGFITANPDFVDKIK